MKLFLSFFRFLSSYRLSIGLLSLVLTSMAVSPVQSQDIFIDLGSEWKFFRGTEAPSAPDPDTGNSIEWRLTNFDDGSWETGNTGIGYSDDDDTTVLEDMREDLKADPPQPGYSTVYFRSTFNLADKASIQSLLLSIFYDDGFVLYINGIEAVRSYCGAVGEELNFDGFASGTHEAAALVEYFDLTSHLDLLVDGENLIAVEGHNSSLGSSDFSFNMSLSGNDPRGSCISGITCSKTLSEVVIDWTSAVVLDSVSVTRDGAPLAGSPFLGDVESVVDSAPGDFSSEYSVVFNIAGVDCEPVTCSIDPEFTLIDDDEEWMYFKGQVAPSDPPEAWREESFDDTGWEKGITGIGYADDDDVTVLDDMEDNYGSVFFRKKFTAVNTDFITNLSLSIDFDDGFIAFINGVEVGRDNMGDPGVEVAFDEFSDGDHEAGTPEFYNVSAFISDLVNGENVLAVQVHNTNISSSDFSFIPSLSINSCDLDLSCSYDVIEDSVTLTIDALASDSFIVLKNGQPIPGSPFSGDTTAIVDDSPFSAYR